MSEDIYVTDQDVAVIDAFTSIRRTQDALTEAVRTLRTVGGLDSTPPFSLMVGRTSEIFEFLLHSGDRETHYASFAKTHQYIFVNSSAPNFLVATMFQLAAAECGSRLDVHITDNEFSKTETDPEKEQNTRLQIIAIVDFINTQRKGEGMSPIELRIGGQPINFAEHTSGITGYEAHRRQEEPRKPTYAFTISPPPP